MKNKVTLGVIFALVSTILYGLSPTVTKLAFQSGLTLSSLLFLRCTLALILSLAACRVKGVSLKLGKTQAGWVIFIAAACFFTNVLQTEGYRYLSGMIASTVACTYIIFILIIELIIGRVKATPKKIGALILTILGVGCIFVCGDIKGTNLYAFLLCLAGSLCAAFWYVPMNNESVKEVSEESLMVYTLLPFTVYFGIEGLISGEQLLATTPKQWLYALILGVAILFVSRLIFYKAVRYIGASKASMIDMLEPFFSGVFGMITLQEKIPFGVLAGTVITVIAIIISMDERDAKKKDAEK